ncbi:DUF1570 domain-containing protein [Aquisphaera insulae]|uniref:DUF1570 domain-containing protein n=1 Tax=Aquisphaera insulae TaxID=2712864 RepID=UPI0013ED3E95|nr:DUF1570 domain-containing protein [Aquisphaera insulae]
MSPNRGLETTGTDAPSRRDVLRWLALGCGTCMPMASAAAQPPAARQDDREPEKPGDLDEAAIRRRLEKLGLGPIVTARSPHYVAIGDAPPAFMKVIVDDCEQIAVDFMGHFRSRKFDLRLPEKPLLVVVYRDDRSFGKFFNLPSLLDAAAQGHPVQPAGVYEPSTNLLHVFDWRSVPMMARSGHRNAETLSHEGTHQLSFNTGLLQRGKDIPLAIVEGLGAYGEARKTDGPSDLGRLNLKRLDDLAKIQRRIPWIPLRTLLADDTVLRVGRSDRVFLGYAESWLLVHYLLKDPAAVPRFRNFLRAIATREDPSRRLDDAAATLGDLDVIDQELRRYQVKLQMSVR